LIVYSFDREKDEAMELIDETNNEDIKLTNENVVLDDKKSYIMMLFVALS
jgi:hypothetical protein